MKSKAWGLTGATVKGDIVMKRRITTFLALVLTICISFTVLAAGNINMSVFDSTKTFKVKTDSLEGKAVVDVADIYDFKVDTGRFGDKLYFYPSLVRLPEGYLYFRLVGEYYASDWAFFNTLVIKVNNVTYTFKDVDSKRSILGGGDIAEGMVAALSSDNSMKFLEAVKQHCYEPIRGRFKGSKADVDFEIPQKIKDAIVEAYDLYCAAGGLNQNLPDIGNTVLVTEMEPTIEDKENNYISVYNYNYYRENNPDLVTLYGDNRESYLDHFVNVGMKEGRQGSENFNLAVYKANNPDLVSSFGDDNVKYYEHYISSGRAEGRKAV